MSPKWHPKGSTFEGLGGSLDAFGHQKSPREATGRERKGGDAEGEEKGCERVVAGDLSHAAGGGGGLPDLKGGDPPPPGLFWVPFRRVHHFWEPFRSQKLLNGTQTDGGSLGEFITLGCHFGSKQAPKSS